MLLSQPLSVKAADDLIAETPINQLEEIADEHVEQNIQEKLPRVAPPETLPVGTFKEPVSKKKIAKKFILAMLGVSISSLLIFLILTLYNKLRYPNNSFLPADNEHSLQTPDDIESAVRVFLEKTK